MIDHSRKLIFIHIARTGGTSVETALVGKDWWRIDPETKHISAKQAREIYGEKIWNSYTKFSIVRNPWDRVASMWATKWWHKSSHVPENCTFEEFLENLKYHPHEKYASLFYHEILNEDIDYILRFESLKADFYSMLNRLGYKTIRLPHKEKRRRKPYRDLYNEKTRSYVENLFKIDIERYGYSFE